MACYLHHPGGFYPLVEARSHVLRVAQMSLQQFYQTVEQWNEFAAQHASRQSQRQLGVDMPNINQMMPSKYLKKEDVPQPALVTIRKFTHENVAPSGQPEEKKWIMHVDEFENGMVMNPTNLQLTAIALGSEDTEDWIGHQVVLFNDPNVSFGGKLTGGIRIRQVRRKPVAPPVAPPPRQPAPAFDDMDDDIPF